MHLEFLGLMRDAETAGPGVRLEYFTKGCIRGVINPCEGCFNESSWTFGGAKKTMTVEEVVNHALECAWNRQVTFCGGEPMLQAKAITEVVKRLKQCDPNFHVVMYTAYKLDTLLKYGLKFTWVPKYGQDMLEALLSYGTLTTIVDGEVESPPGYYAHAGIDIDDCLSAKSVEFILLTPEDVRELLTAMDIIVDGDYQFDKRLTTDQYMHKGWFIGSANQRVIDCEQTINVCNTEEGEMIYQTAEEFNAYCEEHQPCLTCTQSTKGKNVAGQYCSIQCKQKHRRYEERMKSFEQQV